MVYLPERKVCNSKWSFIVNIVVGKEAETMDKTEFCSSCLSLHQQIANWVFLLKVSSETENNHHNKAGFYTGRGVGGIGCPPYFSVQVVNNTRDVGLFNILLLFFFKVARHLASSFSYLETSICKVFLLLPIYSYQKVHI